jgi:hypothetical protein
MIEVARSPLACLLFGHFHPEPYVPDAPDWSFPEGNNMMSANQALSWIVFDRDLERFHQTFPDLTVECRQNLPWFNYLVSGGVTRRPLLPRVFESVVAWVDRVTAPLGGLFALHWHIRIRKRA